MSRPGSPALRVATGAWLAAAVLVPLGIVARISLSESVLASPPYRPAWPGSLDPAAWTAFLSGLSLDTYRTLLDDPVYLDSLLSSLRLAAVATALTVPIGYGVALAVARAPARIRPLLVAATVLPFWTSFLVRVYAWIAILKPDGWLNAALAKLGLISAPLTVLDSDAAVLIGLVYAYLPFAILPIYGSLERQDPALVEAAADLGASPLARFRTVTLPLSWPGIVAAALLCFIPMVGEFVVPELLGGAETLMLGRTLWSEFFSNRDWPQAAAVAIVTVAVLVIPIVVFRQVESRRLEGFR